ncbi:hypothetical protein D9M68_813820 [compost metagenome]
MYAPLEAGKVKPVNSVEFPVLVPPERVAPAAGKLPVSAAASWIFFAKLVRSLWIVVSFALFWIPLYATMVIAARIPIMTITIRSSTIVNPACGFLISFMIAPRTRRVTTSPSPHDAIVGV